MATAAWAPWILNFEGTKVPFQESALSIGNELTREDVDLAGHLKLSAAAVTKKRPFIRCTVKDPRFVTDWTEISGTGTYSFVRATYRELEENGNWGSTYRSYEFTNGILVPRSMRSELAKLPELEFDIHGLFDSGAAYTLGSAADTTLAAMDEEYAPKSIVLGGSTISAPQLVSVNLDWEIEPEDNDAYEPGYLFTRKNRIKGSVVLRDLTEATVARLDDGGTEDICTITLQDHSVAANSDLAYTLGKVFIETSISGRDATIEFVQVES